MSGDPRHPFRFGVQIADFPGADWVARVRRLEALGYATVFCPDHFSPQMDPTAFVAAAAAVTTRLRVGTLVYDVDYRHPVVYAKQAATIERLSGGRHEFGIGAGWMETDYRQAGIPYERPGVRIERLAEALAICEGMWAAPEEGFSFEGRHFRVKDVPRAIDQPVRPKLLIGGGGRRLLSLAGRHADVVGINPRLEEGRVSAATPADLAPERVREKVAWVREAAARAGRDPAAIELQSLVFVTAITDTPAGLREMLARSSGMSVAQVAGCPLFLTGPASEIRDRLEARRDETGISYVVIQGRDPAVVERFAAEVVAPLAGR
ncbi:MAG: TIGR03621 family F420-dependent LLM class oxidoreductase [Deltaproteobacteria bacterium]|nr:TIGR03621 family F420-dependent LLM class oxidoreductase [Deltaproteobacteria bacterium]